MIIGECGTSDSYPIPEFRSIQASNFIARAAAHGIKCIWWDNGSNYAIIDRRDFSKSDTLMIAALINGSKGVAYQVTDEMSLNDIGQFVLRMPNLKNGEIEEKSWGTLTTDFSGDAIPVNAGDNCIISLERKNEATDIWLQRVTFYDAAGNYISGKELQSAEYMDRVPEDAAYMRVSINSPIRSLSYEQYGAYIANNDIELNISFFGVSNVVPIIISSK